MHPIDAYAKRHDLSLGTIAAGLGILLSSLWRVKTGRRRPSAELLRRIHKFTGGEVTANDILGTFTPAGRYVAHAQGEVNDGHEYKPRVTVPGDAVCSSGDSGEAA